MSILNVVIAGAGFAGVSLARELANKPGVMVTLISDKKYFCYFPTLYHAATGHPGSESSIPLESIFENTKNVLVIQDVVVGIDKDGKKVKTESSQDYDYDVLAIGLGVVTSYFGIKGLEENAFGVKSIQQVEALKAHFHQVLIDDEKPDTNYLVVGAGPTGVELAGAMSSYLRTIVKRHRLRRSKVSIALVEAAPRVLPRSAEVVSQKVTRRLRKLGVKVMVEQKVEGATSDSLVVNGRPIESQTVIWTAGVTNHPFFGQQGELFKLNERHKVEVDAYLQAADGIYVIGDNASTPFSGLAQIAVHDGKFVAKNILRMISGQKMEEYTTSQPVTVVPVGPGWAAVEGRRWHLTGRIGSWMRRAADLVGYLDVLPVKMALALWIRRHDHYDDCYICRRNSLR